MDFLEIQDEVLSDRFAETKRANAKRWINARYGRLWGMQPWTFKLLNSTVTLPQGANSLALSTFQRVFRVWDPTDRTQAAQMRMIRPEDLYDEYAASSGYPEGFSIINGTLYSDRIANSARTLRIVGEAKWTELVLDADEPLVPPEYHYALVSGAASMGLRLENDPSWQGFEDDWNRALEDLMKNYLTQGVVFEDASPSWP